MKKYIRFPIDYIKNNLVVNKQQIYKKIAVQHHQKNLINKLKMLVLLHLNHTI